MIPKSALTSVNQIRTKSEADQLKCIWCELTLTLSSVMKDLSRGIKYHSPIWWTLSYLDRSSTHLSLSPVISNTHLSDEWFQSWHIGPVLGPVESSPRELTPGGAHVAEQFSGRGRAQEIYQLQRDGLTTLTRLIIPCKDARFLSLGLSYIFGSC